MENPYEPTGGPSIQEESIAEAQPSPKLVLFAFLIGAGAGLFSLLLIGVPLFFPSFLREHLPLLFVAFFPIFGLLSSRFRLPGIYCYSGLVFALVVGAVPGLMNSKFFPLDLLILLGYTFPWWVGVFINLILTGRWRARRIRIGRAHTLASAGKPSSIALRSPSE